jgi:hypothetical protein
MQAPRFEELEHTADWALRVRGQDLADLLRSGLAAGCPARTQAQWRELQLILDRDHAGGLLAGTPVGIEMRQVAYP